MEGLTRYLVKYLARLLFLYCGVEQRSARVAHNHEVGGLNPSSATN